MDTEESPNYYAILVASVRYDNELPANAKLLYAEITALSNQKGYCWASNGYFAKLYKVNRPTVSLWISALEKRGHIKVELDRQAGNKRRLQALHTLPRVTVT